MKNIQNEAKFHTVPAVLAYGTICPALVIKTPVTLDAGNVHHLARNPAGALVLAHSYRQRHICKL